MSTHYMIACMNFRLHIKTTHLFSIAKIEAQEDKREGDSEPETEEGNHRGEGNLEHQDF